MHLRKVNLGEKFDLIKRQWDPAIVGRLNGQHVKIAKLEGVFVWHKHEQEDELFLVIEGHLEIELEEGSIHLEPGEFVIIPRGVMHKPIARKEVKVLLFEPESTLNTGNIENDLTRKNLKNL